MSERMMVESVVKTRRRGSTKEYLRLIASESRIGRIRRAVKRAFIVSGGQPIVIRQVLEFGYPRLKRFSDWHYLAARRALRKEAIIIARNRFGRGRPNLWAPISTQHGRDMTKRMTRNQ